MMGGKITNFTLKNVRCLEGEQSARMRRVTLLVGENNSGKTTFLGCYNTFAHIVNLRDLEDRANHYDAKPFCMGAFGTVVRSGKKKFVVEGTFEDHLHHKVRITYIDGKEGYPLEQEVYTEFEGKEGEKLWLRITRSMKTPEIWQMDGPKFSYGLDSHEVSYRQFSAWLSNAVRRGHLPFRGEASVFRKREGRSADGQVEFGKCVSFLRTEFPLPGDESPTIAVEAVPPELPPLKRTYKENPLEDANSQKFRQYLAKLGEEMDLFTDIRVAQAGTSCFEIQVKVHRKWRNIADVGYGIHSIIPLLKKFCKAPEGAVFLVQEPETHLHPKAQAALAQIMAESEFRFVIETHSDHLIDRFRICIMEGDMTPDDLSIVFFERQEDATVLHNISADAEGNLEGAPKCYREFFLEETRRLLGL